MKKEFQVIDAPKGKLIDSIEVDDDKLTIFYRTIEPDLPKSWEELEEINAWCVDDLSRICHTIYCPTSNDVRNSFPTKEEAEASIALAQLCQLRDRYNDGWKPDWGNVNTIKYCISRKGHSFRVFESWENGSVLHFKSKEIAEQFLENFRDLIEKAKPLL